MRKPIQYKSYIPNRSVVRWNDGLWMIHDALVDKETGHIKLIVSSFGGSKVRIIHNRELDEVELEFTMPEN